MMIRRVAILASTILLTTAAFGQKVAQRIGEPINDGKRVTLFGSRPARALPANDAGAVSPSMQLQGMSMALQRTDAQETALQALITAQQDPASPKFHQWLTPESFAAQFGVSETDLEKVKTWLEQHGFTVDEVAPSRNRITFSGNAGQVAAAFGTELRNYSDQGETHFSPSTELTIPAALSGLVSSINNLSSFRPKPSARFRVVRPAFTSNQSGNHFFTPKDIATVYNVNAAYNAGYTGAGQSIVIVGQSAVLASDITNFQTAAGLTAKAPTMVLVPNTGSSTRYTGDESESDLDLEYSSSIAKGATVFFVYTGDSANSDVSTAIDYAIVNRIAPVISVSYGFCEGANSSSFLNSQNSYLAQAAAQGQSVIASSGDTGSSGCYGYSSLSTSVTQSLQVSWPASSQYATAIGGTEITAASNSSSAYWAGTSGSDVISSALSYIPEISWNDGYSGSGSTVQLSSTGGGTSLLFARPSWQTGVGGIAAGSFRLVPDVSLYSSSSQPGYLYCSSDSSVGITGSCSTGFRDVNNTSLTVAGGTSFAAPIFAGMIAIINQAKNSTGQGVLGSTLYPLAANATTYATAFHDITTGTNKCPAASGACSTATQNSFSAGVGYDQVTGLGSIDFNNLLSVWPVKSTSASLVASLVTATPATTTPTVGGSDTISITVASGSASSTTTPTGTVAVTVDGQSAGSLTLASGKTTYNFSSNTTGAHVINLVYSGDSIYAGSSTTLTLTVGAIGVFTVSVPNLTVAQGASGSTTVTVTPSGGYTGTIKWTLTTANTLNYACYSISNLAVTGTTTASTNLTIYTNSSACSSAGSTGAVGLQRLGSGVASSKGATTPDGRGAGLTFAALLGFSLLGFRARRLGPLCAVLVFGALLSAISGCGSGGSSTSGTGGSNGANAPKGSYSATLTGTDTVSSTITASGNFTLVIN